MEKEKPQHKGYNEKYPGSKPMFYSKELAKINKRTLAFYKRK